MSRFLLGASLLLASLCTSAADVPRVSDAERIRQGRYLVEIAGCNDCHTAGYAPSGGKVPEAQWLTGDALGFAGPWGTTYPGNLRLRLMMAKLALMMRQNDIWRSEIQAVEGLVQSRYDLQTVDGKRALTLAAQLAEANVAVELPEALNSRAAGSPQMMSAMAAQA